MSALSALYREHRNGRTLRQPALDSFLENGVPVLALIKARSSENDMLLTDDVVFVGERAFEFARYCSGEQGETAFTLLLRGTGGEPLDIAAWHPRTGRLASWLGQAALLGEDELFAPRLGEPLQVHPDPLSWLRSSRDGVVVLDPIHAPALLRQADCLAAASPEHGHQLRELLTLAPPPIVVPQLLEVAA